MKVLTVCLGNICRSPLAHGILRAKAEGLGWEIDSAGTSGYHEGDTPDHRSVAIARKHGLNISDIISRKFEIDDFKNFDLIYVMDQSNYDNVMTLAVTEDDRRKVKLILNEVTPGMNNIVPDPYFGDLGFENVYQMLNEATDLIIENHE